MIQINNDKAIDITKDKIRAYRKPLLEALDVEVMRNITNSDKLSEIEIKKQELRDMTILADGKSVDELKSIIEELEAKIDKTI